MVCFLARVPLAFALHVFLIVILSEAGDALSSLCLAFCPSKITVWRPPSSGFRPQLFGLSPPLCWCWLTSSVGGAYEWGDSVKVL